MTSVSARKLAYAGWRTRPFFKFELRGHFHRRIISALFKRFNEFLSLKFPYLCSHARASRDVIRVESHAMTPLTSFEPRDNV